MPPNRRPTVLWLACLPALVSPHYYIRPLLNALTPAAVFSPPQPAAPAPALPPAQDPVAAASYLAAARHHSSLMTWSSR